MSEWVVIRTVKEYFWVQDAADQEEAIKLAENPYRIEVVKEIARRKEHSNEQR